MQIPSGFSPLSYNSLAHIRWLLACQSVASYSSGNRARSSDALRRRIPSRRILTYCYHVPKDGTERDDFSAPGISSIWGLATTCRSLSAYTRHQRRTLSTRNWKWKRRLIASNLARARAPDASKTSEKRNIGHCEKRQDMLSVSFIVRFCWRRRQRPFQFPVARDNKKKKYINKYKCATCIDAGPRQGAPRQNGTTSAKVKEQALRSLIKTGPVTGHWQPERANNKKERRRQFFFLPARRHITTSSTRHLTTNNNTQKKKTTTWGSLYRGSVLLSDTSETCEVLEP